MSDAALRTLFHPFETGVLAMPGKASRALLIGVGELFGKPSGFAAAMDFVQGYRPFFLALEKAGHKVAPRAPAVGYELALIRLGRHRRQNEAWMAEAIARVRPGGLVVVAGGKTDGIDAMRRKTAVAAPLGGHLAKYHATAFWLERPEAPADLIAALQPAPLPLVEGRFSTAPGMFSPDHVDPGSSFLAASLPAGLSGEVADFGAGWGYLSAMIAERCPAVRRLDLYEADFESVEAARRNLAQAAERMPVDLFWHDLLAEPVARLYDHVVMNPPFHAGRAAIPELGRSMIRMAARSLRPGGRLYLVANRPLPYEAALGEAFGDSGEICRDGRFKVLWATASARKSRAVSMRHDA